MPDQDTDETEARAFAGAEPLEEPAGESPPLPERDQPNLGRDMAVAIAGHTGLRRRPEPDNDDDDDEAEEDAPGSPEGEGSHSSPAAAMADAETAEAVALEALEEMEAGELPTLDTDHELAAYWSGYRAGGDDPGWLLTLAEMRRHLGSFFRPEEEEAFNELSTDDFWSRWTLGYIDAAAGRMARPKEPRKPEAMDF